VFHPDELPEIKSVLRERTWCDKKILDALREEVRMLKPDVRAIKPRSATAVSLVASDGGNNTIVFDPFHVQLVRVVDSYGKKLCLDAITPMTDTDALSRAQFHRDGRPRTALGYMMADLNIDPPTLHTLSPMIPDGREIRERNGNISPSWVLVYRDLCEWAVIYERICNRSFATDTLIVRDGFLRSKLFRGDRFIRFRENIEKSIRRIYAEDRRKVYLAGIAKKSKVLTRYHLAMAIENIFPPGDPQFVRIPRFLEEKAYVWPEYARGAEVTEGEMPKFVAGDMFFVRFGSRSSDPVWAVDILTGQSDQASEIFSYLLADALDGFPVPMYPRCLQKAHEHAEVIGFDREILQDVIFDSIRELLRIENKEHLLDAMRLQTDVAARRYP
jgi:hypothetical protein